VFAWEAGELRNNVHFFFAQPVDPVGLEGGIWWMAAAGGSGWAPALPHWAAGVVVRLILEGRVILEEKKKCEACEKQHVTALQHARQWRQLTDASRYLVPQLGEEEKRAGTGA
jgi:hypothetical protein